MQRSMAPLRPTKLMKEIIYVKTNRLGFIPQIKMQGPIITPIPITREVAKSMVVAGIEVFEVYKDRHGKKQVRLLTLENVYPGEGESEPVIPSQEKDGVQKTKVPTSGVVQQEPVKPVDLKGVTITEEKSEGNTTSETESAEGKKTEGKKEENDNSSNNKSQQNNTNKHNKNKKK